jgi:hypothetical protein
MATDRSFSRLFIRFAALPLLFIAGLQLYILSERTDYYFAWTIAPPLTAAFLGAGFWGAMTAFHMTWWQSASMSQRITGPTSIAATVILGIATFLHLDRFHLDSPAFLTRFVTWVWIIVYVVTPFIFVWLWYAYGRSTDETMGAKPFPKWVRAGYLFQAAGMLPAGALLFLVPNSIIPFWPWALTPLTARAVSAWMLAFGLACVTVNRENNTANTLGTRISLFAFCVLQLIAVARYFSSFELAKPLAWVYLLVLSVGVVINAPALFSRTSNSGSG